MNILKEEKGCGCNEWIKIAKSYKSGTVATVDDDGNTRRFFHQSRKIPMYRNSVFLEYLKESKDKQEHRKWNKEITEVFALYGCTRCGDIFKVKIDSRVKNTSKEDVIHGCK